MEETNSDNNDVVKRLSQLSKYHTVRKSKTVGVRDLRTEESLMYKILDKIFNKKATKGKISPTVVKQNEE